MTSSVITTVVLLVSFSLACMPKSIPTNDTILPAVPHISIVNGEYLTEKDKSLEEPETTRKPCRKASEESSTSSEEDATKTKTEGLSDVPFVFNDTTPFNGTEVVEIFELVTILPLCDD